ncbi:hypothetical protein R1flu_008538 [Riccia fluitans]|uniref:Uncharacterized protein n=1 Tax=Riccia fluitans TaxID=41844 RepID=A0ABD1YC02_9MARC
MPRDELGTPKQGLGTPGSGKGIDSILPCVRRTRGSEKGIDLILPRAHRTRETPGSKKVTHLPLRSAEPEKGSETGIGSILTLHAQDPKKVSTRISLARVGSAKGIDSILTLCVQDSRLQDPKKDSRLQASWTPAQNPETQQLADSITFAYDLKIS